MQRARSANATEGRDEWAQTMEDILWRRSKLGLHTTEDTQKMVLPENVKTVEFRDAIAEAGKVAPELRAKADIVIAATHMGHYQNGEHGSNAPGDVEMARAVGPCVPSPSGTRSAARALLPCSRSRSASSRFDSSLVLSSSG